MLNTYLPYLLARINLRCDKGQTAVEYSLVIVLVSLVVAGALATGITGLFEDFWADIKAKV